MATKVQIQAIRDAVDARARTQLDKVLALPADKRDEEGEPLVQRAAFLAGVAADLDGLATRTP